MPLRVGPGDDAVVLADGWTWSVDALVEGVHFDGRSSAMDVGFKAVAVSVSDVAAMGVRPTTLLLAVSVRPDGDAAFVDALADGVGAACARFGVVLVGGDTTRCNGGRVVTSMVGGLAGSRVLTRSGARPGDSLWVTGIPGLAGVGWSTPQPPDDAIAALRRPDPPVAFACALAEQGLASAAMDLSDGIGVDLPRLCRASGVGAVIRTHDLPPHDAVGLRHALFGGDDYGLLFTVPPGLDEAVRAEAASHGVQVACVGAVLDGAGVTLDGASWPEPLFTHFPEVVGGRP